MLLLSRLKELIQLVHILSIDIIISALAITYWLSKEYLITLSFNYYILLANSIAIIYWADHLFDSENTDRKQLFINYKTTFLCIILLLIFINIFLLHFLSLKVIITAFVLLSIVGIYTLFQNKIANSKGKEFITSFGYSAGCGIFLIDKPFLMFQNPLPIVSLFLIASQNALLISFLDGNQKQNQFSIYQSKLFLIALSIIGIYLNFNNLNIIIIHLIYTLLALFPVKKEIILVRSMIEISFVIILLKI